MSFGEAIGAVFGNYANFSGRSRRAEYWYFTLFIAVVYIVVMLLFVRRPLIGGFIACMGLFALMIPGMAVNVRRLHDIDHSGWWVLIGFVPLIGALILLIWHCTPGTAGPNRFGGDPKAA